MCLRKSADFSVRSCPLNSFLCLLESPNPAVVLTERLTAPVGTAQSSTSFLGTAQSKV